VNYLQSFQATQVGTNLLQTAKKLFVSSPNLFPCSLLLAIIGHFHNCLLFHPSTLITNNHFVGGKKFKS